MNATALQEVSVLSSLFGEGSVVETTPGEVLIKIPINGESVTVKFIIPQKYPDEQLAFSFVDAGKIDDVTLSSVISSLESAKSYLKGMNSIVPLAMELQSIIMNQNTNQGMIGTPSGSRSDVVRTQSLHFTPQMAPQEHTENSASEDILFYLYKKIMQTNDNINEKDPEKSAVFDDNELANQLKELRVVSQGYTPPTDVVSRDKSRSKALTQCLNTILDGVMFTDDVRKSIKNEAGDELEDVLTSVLTKSRFIQDFQVIHTLGRGGYGSVIEAKKNLDGHVYAVKCIPIEKGESVESMRREIKIISKLVHRYVVRYFYAWHENCTDQAAREIRDIFKMKDDLDDYSMSYSMSMTWGRHNNTGGADAQDLISDDDQSEDDLAGFLPDGNFEEAEFSFGNDDYEESDDQKPENGYKLSRSNEKKTSTDSLAEAPKSSVTRSFEILDYEEDEEDIDNKNKEEEEEEDFDDEIDIPDDFFDNTNDDEEFCDGSAPASGPTSYSSQLADQIPFCSTVEDDIIDSSEEESQSSSDAKNEEVEEDNDIVRDGNHFLFLQMELCSGKSLDELFHNDNFFKNENQQWRITRQVLEALQYIHGQGVIHRDMKPANIFIDADGNVKLGDFGLSRALEVKARKKDEGDADLYKEATGRIQGSFPYTAPEVLKGADYDTKSDMYSFGVILFEIWCQFSTMSERARILRGLTDNDEIPIEWTQKHPVQAKLISSLISKNPAKRPSASDLLKSQAIPLVNVSLSNEEVSDLVGAISSGDWDNQTQLKSILEALFSPSRLPPTQGDAGNPGFLGVDEALGRLYLATNEIARTYGAGLLMPPIIEPLTVDYTDGVNIMLHSGSLFALRTNLWRYLTKWAHRHYKGGEQRVYQISSVVSGPKNGEVKTGTAISYSVISKAEKPPEMTPLHHYIECTQFVCDVIAAIAPSKQVTIVVSDARIPYAEVAEMKLNGERVPNQGMRRHIPNFVRGNLAVIPEDVLKMLNDLKSRDLDEIKMQEQATHAGQLIACFQKLGASGAISLKSCEFEMLSAGILSCDSIFVRIVVDGVEVAQVGTFCTAIDEGLRKYDSTLPPMPMVVSAIAFAGILRKIAEETSKEPIVLVIPAWEIIKDTPPMEWGPIPESSSKWFDYFNDDQLFIKNLRDSGLKCRLAINEGLSMPDMMERWRKSGFTHFITRQNISANGEGNMSISMYPEDEELKKIIAQYYIDPEYFPFERSK